MPSIPRLSTRVAIAAASLGIAATAIARSSEWKKPNGETFRADASELIGPWALFDDGTLLPLNTLSNEDCIRFHDALKTKPARAADWKTATSGISTELYGRLLHYSSGSDLVRDNQDGRIEPEFFMMFYTAGDKNKSWNMLGGTTPELYAKMMKSHPDLVQGVVYSDSDDAQDHYDVATNTKGDWMFTMFDSEKLMRRLQRMVPTNLFGILVVTRDGVPLFGPDASTEDQIKATFENFNSMLNHMRPDDPVVWIARAHYFRAVQPVEYANGTCDPMIMGNPLVEAKLRQMKIYQVDATFHVAADGRITSVEVKPGDMPPKTVAMFSAGFQKGCVFVPAVDHGKFVDGIYNYHMEVSH